MSIVLKRPLTRKIIAYYQILFLQYLARKEESGCESEIRENKMRVFALVLGEMWASPAVARRRFSESDFDKIKKPSYAKASEGEGGAAGGRTRVQTSDS